jgi:hypothetical protein
MKLGRVFACALLVGLLGSNASAAVRISNDPGGQIGPYLDNFESVRNSGQKVVIDGPCLSACTLVLGIVPRDRICVTGRAKLGFHAAWLPDSAGRPAFSAAGTKALWEIYPAPVRTWLTKKGGLKHKMVFLSGTELASMYPSCR